MQDDRLIDTLTVRETLMFAARLKVILNILSLLFYFLELNLVLIIIII